jgi:hypothetical protein
MEILNVGGYQSTIAQEAYPESKEQTYTSAEATR